MSAEIHGIWGQPFVDLSDFVDVTCFPELHDEITRGLVDAECTYTGGSLKWMGICAPWVMADPYRDVNFVLEELAPEQFAVFCGLADSQLDPANTPRIFGDETDRPLSRRQMRWLEVRHGVYFPWRTCFHFLENHRWEDKHRGAGKYFSAAACALFPRTVAFLRALPFAEIGRAVLFGVDAGAHAPYHRDSEPGQALEIPHSISLHPDPHKQLWLASADGSQRLPIPARAFWFNDMDYHGVEPAPRFRYSIRVDGRFERAFLTKLQRTTRARQR